MNNRDKIVKIINKFDTNYYIKNDEREQMIADVTKLLDDELKSKNKVIKDQLETLDMYVDEIKTFKEESFWETIKRAFSKI